MNHKAAYHTVRGGLQYLWMNVSNWDNRLGAYGGFPPPETTHLVILVPGWLGPAVVMDPLAKRMTNAGFNVCTFHIGFGSCHTIGNLVKKFAEFLRKLFIACPNITHVDGLTHSLGGLVFLDAIAQGLLDGKRVRLVTLGTMLRGTPFAIWGCPFSLSAWQILPFRSRFNPRPWYGRLHNVPFLSIAGEHDIIVPPEFCWHSQATNKIVKADHGTLVINGKAFRMARDFLLGEGEHPPLSDAPWGPR